MNVQCSNHAQLWNLDRLTVGYNERNEAEAAVQVACPLISTGEPFGADDHLPSRRHGRGIFAESPPHDLQTICVESCLTHAGILASWRM